MPDSKRQTRFIEEDETAASRQGFPAPRAPAPAKNEESRLKKRSPVKVAHNQAHCERLVPVFTGSPWKHYEKRYAIKYWCSFGVITSKSTSRQSMIRTITASKTEERVADMCRLVHPNIVRNIEVYSCSDGSHFVISEFMATSILHICRSPIYPNEQQLSSILYQTLCGLNFLGRNGLVHEELSSAAVLISPSGEVKISDIERCKRDGDHARLSDSFCRMMMNLMDKAKSVVGAIGLTHPDQWSSVALDFFTMASSQTNMAELMGHSFMEKRKQEDLEWLVFFVLTTATHNHE